MSRRSLLIAGLLVLAAALLLQAPAASLYAWLRPSDPPPLELYGVEGTLASGRIDGVVRQGRAQLADLRWQLRPAALLLGRLAFQVSTGRDPILLNGQLALAPGGRLRLSGFQAQAALRPLLASVGYLFVPVDGQAAVDLSRLVMRGSQLQHAEGRVDLQGLAWVLGPTPTPLGDYRADVSTEDEIVIARLASVAGPLDASGEARLQPDMSYELQLQLRPKAGAPPMLGNMLRQLGAPDAQGYYRVQRQGSLAPPEVKP
jgi:general secretion pathway protein N